MATADRTTLVILGGGKGGTALLELFSQLPEVELVGIADKNPSAPALVQAKRLGIAVTDDPLTLITLPHIQLIVDVTGDPKISELVTTHKPPRTEVLGGEAAKLLWHLLQHEAATQSQLFQAEKLAGIGTFSSGIAHDINNPLYVILAFAENLLEETNLSEIRSQAKDILEAAHRINTICKGLTQYVRSSSLGEPLPVELTSKLDEALKIARYSTIFNDLSVVRDFACQPVVNAKPEEILQVFVNIMTNAIHAMNGRGTLTLSTRCDNGLASVTITDTGSGIPPENLEKIFVPFFTTKEPGKGTGLGLHAVKSIIKKNLGHIEVESEVGKGTTFRIKFPLIPTS